MNLHGKEYTEVKDRIVDFLAMHPEGMIETSIVWHSPDFSAVCIGATVHPNNKEEGYYFTGLAYEERVQKSGDVNSDAWVENCETSAIGRALANMNIGVNGTRPSAEEMKKVQKRKAEPPTPPVVLSERVAVVTAHLDTLTTQAEVKTQMDTVKDDYAKGAYTEAEYTQIRQHGLTKFNQLKGK